MYSFGKEEIKPLSIGLMIIGFLEGVLIIVFLEEVIVSPVAPVLSIAIPICVLWVLYLILR